MLNRVNLLYGLVRRKGVRAIVAEATGAEVTAVDLDRFVETEYPRVVGAVGLITGNQQDAADAVQDALLGYLARPPKREISNLAAWITVAAVNRSRDIHRSRAAEARAIKAVGLADEAAHEVAGMDVDIVRALTKLPERQRQVCVLHYVLDQSIDTIAEGLGVSGGTVKTQLHRARKTLAAELRREDHRG